MLEGVGPQVAQGADTTLLRDIMNRTAERVGEELKDQPEVEATIRSHLGVTFHQIRDFDAADENLVRALELSQQLVDGDDRSVAQNLGNLGDLRATQKRYEEAERLMRASLAMYRRLSDGDNSDLAWAITDWAICWSS